MRKAKKYRIRLHMSKTRGNAIRLKLTTLLPALKKRADKSHAGVRLALVGTNCF